MFCRRRFPVKTVTVPKHPNFSYVNIKHKKVTLGRLQSQIYELIVYHCTLLKLLAEPLIDFPLSPIRELRSEVRHFSGTDCVRH